MTVFIVNILSYFATVLVHQLINSTCDQVKWGKCFTEKGVSVQIYLALSASTPVSGFIHLLLSPVPKILSLKLKLSSHRWSSLQR